MDYLKKIIDNTNYLDLSKEKQEQVNALAKGYEEYVYNSKLDLMKQLDKIEEENKGKNPALGTALQLSPFGWVYSGVKGIIGTLTDTFTALMAMGGRFVNDLKQVGINEGRFDEPGGSFIEGSTDFWYAFANPLVDIGTSILHDVNSFDNMVKTSFLNFNKEMYGFETNKRSQDIDKLNKDIKTFLLSGKLNSDGTITYSEGSDKAVENHTEDWVEDFAFDWAKNGQYFKNNYVKKIANISSFGFGNLIEENGTNELGNFVDGVFESVGRMIPMIISAKLGIPPKASVALSEVYFFSSSFGDAFGSAVEKGASLEEAYQYAYGSATIESLTEKIGGIKVGQLLPTGKDAVNVIIQSMVEEGSEEVASEIASAGLESIITNDVDNSDFWARAGYAFASGAISGGIMTGVGQASYEHFSDQGKIDYINKKIKKSYKNENQSFDKLQKTLKNKTDSLIRTLNNPDRYNRRDFKYNKEELKKHYIEEYNNEVDEYNKTKKEDKQKMEYIVDLTDEQVRDYYNRDKLKGELTSVLIEKDKDTGLYKLNKTGIEMTTDLEKYVQGHYRGNVIDDKKLAVSKNRDIKSTINSDYEVATIEDINNIKDENKKNFINNTLKKVRNVVFIKGTEVPAFYQEKNNYIYINYEKMNTAEMTDRIALHELFHKTLDLNPKLYDKFYDLIFKDKDIKDALIQNLNEKYSQMNDGDIIGGFLKDKETFNRIKQKYEKANANLDEEVMAFLIEQVFADEKLMTELMHLKPKQFKEMIKSDVFKDVREKTDNQLYKDSKVFKKVRKLYYKYAKKAINYNKTLSELEKSVKLPLESQDVKGNELTQDQKNLFQGTYAVNKDGKLLVVYPSVMNLDKIDFRFDSIGQETTDDIEKHHKDSYAKDENGNLVHGYHGTNARFNIFLQSFNDFNQYGFYVTDYMPMAEGYGEYIMELYINIKHPLIIDAKNSNWNNIEIDEKINYTNLSLKEFLSEEFEKEKIDFLDKKMEKRINKIKKPFTKKIEKIVKEEIEKRREKRFKENDLAKIIEPLFGLSNDILGYINQTIPYNKYYGNYDDEGNFVYDAKEIVSDMMIGLIDENADDVEKKYKKNTVKNIVNSIVDIKRLKDYVNSKYEPPASFSPEDYKEFMTTVAIARLESLNFDFFSQERVYKEENDYKAYIYNIFKEMENKNSKYNSIDLYGRFREELNRTIEIDDLDAALESDINSIKDYAEYFLDEEERKDFYEVLDEANLKIYKKIIKNKENALIKAKKVYNDIEKLLKEKGDVEIVREEFYSIDSEAKALVNTIIDNAIFSNNPYFEEEVKSYALDFSKEEIEEYISKIREKIVNTNEFKELEKTFGEIGKKEKEVISYFLKFIKKKKVGLIKKENKTESEKWEIERYIKYGVDEYRKLEKEIEEKSDFEYYYKDYLNVIYSADNWAKNHYKYERIRKLISEIGNILKVGEDIDSSEIPQFLKEYVKKPGERIITHHLSTRDIMDYVGQHQDIYDGAIIRNVYDYAGGPVNGEVLPANVYIPLHSNQLKLVSNKHPTDDDRIDFRLTADSEIEEDSSGKKLTPDQEKYFYGSKAVNEKGQLQETIHFRLDTEGRVLTPDQEKYLGDKVLNEKGEQVVGFHGTEADRIEKFDTIFNDADFWGNHKVGFYFSDSEIMSSSYRRDKTKGGVYRYYLKFDNPLIIDAQNRNWNDIPVGKKHYFLTFENAVKAIQNKMIKDEESLISFVHSAFTENDADADLEDYIAMIKDFVKEGKSIEDIIEDDLNFGEDKERMYKETLEELYNFDDEAQNVLEQIMGEYDLESLKSGRILFDLGTNPELKEIAEKEDYYTISTRQIASVVSNEIVDDFCMDGTYATYMLENAFGKITNEDGAEYEGVYDSIIVKNVYDYGSDPGDEFFKPANVYIAFKPEQIKSIDNLHPTSDERVDYRFSAETDEFASIEANKVSLNSPMGNIHTKTPYLYTGRKNFNSKNINIKEEMGFVKRDLQVPFNKDGYDDFINQMQIGLKEINKNKKKIKFKEQKKFVDLLVNKYTSNIEEQSVKDEIYNHLYNNVVLTLANFYSQNSFVGSELNKEKIIDEVERTIAKSLSYVDAVMSKNALNIDTINPEGYMYNKKLYSGLRKLRDSKGIDKLPRGLEPIINLIDAIGNLSLTDADSISTFEKALSDFRNATSIRQRTELGWGKTLATKYTARQQATASIRLIKNLFSGNEISENNGKVKNVSILGKKNLFNSFSNKFMDMYALCGLTGLYSEHSMGQVIMNRYSEAGNMVLQVMNVFDNYFSEDGFDVKNQDNIRNLEKEHREIKNLKYENSKGKVSLSISQIMNLYNVMVREEIRNGLIKKKHRIGESTEYTRNGNLIRIEFNTDNMIEKEAKALNVIIEDRIELLKELYNIMKSDKFFMEYNNKILNYLDIMYDFENIRNKDIKGLELTSDNLTIKRLKEKGIKIEDIAPSLKGMDINKNIYIPLNSRKISDSETTGVFSIKPILDIGINDGMVIGINDNKFALKVYSITDLVTRTTRQTANYYGLYRLTKDLNDMFKEPYTIYDKKNNTYRETTLKDDMDDVSPYIISNLEKLLKDMAGYSKDGDYSGYSINRAIKFLRENFYTASLALNLKVVLTQFSSLWTVATMYGDINENRNEFFTNVMKNLFSTKVRANKVQYLKANSEIYKDRAKTATFEMSEALSNSLTKGKFNEIKRFLMKGITLTDSAINEALFATLIDEGISEERALKITEEAINRYQSSGLAMNKSELLRTDNELVKIFLKFMGEPAKAISNLIDITNQYSVIKELRKPENYNQLIGFIEERQKVLEENLKNEKNNLKELIKEEKEKLKKANKKEAKEINKEYGKKTKEKIINISEIEKALKEEKKIAPLLKKDMQKLVSDDNFMKIKNMAKKRGFALLFSISWQTAMSVMFGLIRTGDKDKEEDENMALYLTKKITSTFIDETIGYLPFIRDAYNTFAKGFDADRMSDFSALNTLGVSTFNLFSDIINGGDFNFGKHTRQIIMSAGQVFGVPTRQIERIIMIPASNISKIFGFDLDYQYRSVTGQRTYYNKELDKAIANGDEGTIKTIIRRKLSEKNLKISPELEREIIHLTSKGVKTTFSGVPSEFSIDGVNYKNDKEKFVKTYSRAITVADKVISSPYYKKLNPKKQSQLIKSVFTYFHTLAKQEISGKKIFEKNRIYSDAQAYKYFLSRIPALYKEQKKEEQEIRINTMKQKNKGN